MSEHTNAPLFRRACLEDLPAIIAMLADDDLGSGREDTTTPPIQPYLEAFASLDADPNQMLVVGEQNGIIIGSAQLSFLSGISQMGARRGQIEGVRIAGPLRGKGIGRIMIAWCIDECRRRGCKSVQLTSHKSRVDAIRFYESLGFKASHQGMKFAL